MKYNIGDKVIKAKPFSDNKYCSHGGKKDIVPLGSIGTITSINRNNVNVRFDNGNSWLLDISELDFERIPWRDIL